MKAILTLQALSYVDCVALYKNIDSFHSIHNQAN